MSSLQSRVLDLGRGVKVQVHEGGHGAPLVFLHGAGGLLPGDNAFLDQLAQHFRVYVPMLPGYDQSEGEDALRDMLDVTLHTFDVLDALKLRRPLLVGHSLGGMIAAEMAAVSPYEVERLVLAAPAGLWLDDHEIPDLFATLPFDIPRMLFHDADLGVQLLTAGADFNDLTVLGEFMVQNARRLGLAGKLLFPIPERGLERRLYRVRAKTLLLWGESDTLISPAYADAFRRLVPHAQLHTIAEAGHMLMYERPQAFADAIRTFASS
ncbi:MAG TPA: alpha/beta fold hydrolase [Candidatus Kryptonia bacterium]|nr:alpha/beta fold hydrolase [Candidatus Kryptonia bacterium]